MSNLEHKRACRGDIFSSSTCTQTVAPPTYTFSIEIHSKCKPKQRWGTRGRDSKRSKNSFCYQNQQCILQISKSPTCINSVPYSTGGCSSSSVFPPRTRSLKLTCITDGERNKQGDVNLNTSLTWRSDGMHESIVRFECKIVEFRRGTKAHHVAEASREAT